MKNRNTMQKTHVETGCGNEPLGRPAILTISNAAFDRKLF